MPVKSTEQTELNKPYPVKSRFRRWGIPAAVGTFAILVALIGFGGSNLIEGVYLDLAEGRARTIDLALAEEAPEGWRRLLSVDTPAQVYLSPAGTVLKRVLEGEVRELGLARLKIYNPHGVIVFSTEGHEIGKTDRSPAFLRAIGSGEKTVVLKQQPDGGALYELYVPLVVADSSTSAVFELYETTHHLNDILATTLLPAVAVPGLLLIILFWALDRLVLNAQADIDGRTRLVNELRGKLERMVSGSAVNAAVDSVGKGRIESKKTIITLFYSDIRDFTGYSETRPPEEVVNFLNNMMDLQVAAIESESGDVDKMIGDAVLARFEGENAESRVVSAARRVLNAVNAGDFPRDVGIGIYTGEVISGAIGGETRMDFTVIGDSVNMSARLCSAAVGGELVVDADTAARAGDGDFEASETISVKGRREPLRVRRWRS